LNEKDKKKRQTNQAGGDYVQGCNTQKLVPCLNGTGNLKKRWRQRRQFTGGETRKLASVARIKKKAQKKKEDFPGRRKEASAIRNWGV